MKIIKPSATIETPLDREAILAHIERAGRTCYKSEDRITPESGAKFIKGIIKSGHESVIEHFSLSVRFICDRGVSHEFVRHRLFSFSQESTRYCNYSKDKHGAELTFIQPCFWGDGNDGAKRSLWAYVLRKSEETYLNLLEMGATPQEARSVLPNSLKTEMVMTGNLRNWRHFLKLRTAKAAHPQARELAIDLHNQLKAILPEVFEVL